MAANKMRGVVEFKDSAGLVWRLRFRTNEMIALAQEFRVPSNELQGHLAALSSKGMAVEDVRTVLKVALGAHHPNVSDAMAGDLMDEIGAVAEEGKTVAVATLELLNQVFTGATNPKGEVRPAQPVEADVPNE
jgi:hypothetical protein